MSVMRIKGIALHQIVATVRIADDVDAPKVKGVRSGYAPHHKFATVDYLASGVHSYVDEDLHYPGETLKARISFPSWEHFQGGVKVGDSFEVLELDRLVGYGTVDEVL
ncbi:hypothetical protein [Paraburkholderia antibiotica]|uniref:hypothetical protein n=1 Tax=Paraburkholderia antibiotica TaxID=2728839 RepID=UPI001980825A|nr:hypothetical protein [Paraburkholderia antibiotica]